MPARKKTTASDATASSLALAGLRVVELGHRIAVPLAGMLLAEQGAGVLRVADIATPDEDPVLSALLARSKSEVTLNLASEEALATLRKLVEQADVVLTDREPLLTLCQELRAGPRPGLISCGIPGFAPHDPRHGNPDYEPTTGMAGCLYEKPLGAPSYHELPVCSVMAAMFGACGTVAALIARLKHGHGQHVGTSMVESSLFAQTLAILIKCGVPRGFLPMKMIGTPFVKSWLCGDGRYIYLHMTLPAHTRRILEMLDELGFHESVESLRGIISPETLRDPSQVKSIAEATRIREEFERIFRQRAARDWEKMLGEELCCVKVRTVTEWLEDCKATGMTDVAVLDDPRLGELMGPGPQVVTEERQHVRPRELRSAAEVLAEWQAAPIQDSPAPLPEGMLPPPLAGYRVLDLSRVIAGPCSARLLAELGAEVTLVQNPTNLDWTLAFHLIFNAGKKSVSLDFTNDEGKARLWKLMEQYQPDIFVQNYRDLTTAKAVGVEPETMFAHFPRLVYTHLNAYGNEGGWKHKPGFEQVVQAVSGIQISYGGGTKPKLIPTPVIDIGSGLTGALSSLLGLYRRERTGQRWFGSTHLTSSAVLFQLGKLAAAQREKALGQARLHHEEIPFDAGNLIVGRILRAWDGHVCVAGPWREVRTWLKASGLANPGPEPNDALWAGLKWSFRMKPSAHWQRTVEEAGAASSVRLQPGRGLKTLVAEYSSVDPRRMPMIRRRAYAAVPTELIFVSAPITLSVNALAEVPTPSPRGGDTREVLARIGEQLPEGAGVIPYPKNKPFFIWLNEFVRWAYFAWKAGNI